ncbi:hypothetical protein V500_06890 [Pseudogymnoascus sp. VKM F-4518 (FW-2643)]|nr:hypothetical protein V500_06890 [Pseudogymnoascus sp. VKM F-4518 (FW-2643)]
MPGISATQESCPFARRASGQQQPLTLLVRRTAALRRDSLAFRRKAQTPITPRTNNPRTCRTNVKDTPAQRGPLVNDPPGNRDNTDDTTPPPSRAHMEGSDIAHPSHRQTLIELQRTLPRPRQRLPMLKPLLLPQLVEERRKRETLVDEELNVSQSSDIHEPSAPDCPSSPSTPTLAKRSHVRYSSSVSSIDNSMHSPLSEIPSSPTFAAMKTSKRSLPDVQEDPLERDEDLDMFDDDLHDVYDWSCDDNHHRHLESSMGRSSVQLSTRPDFEYDLADGITSDPDLGLSITKKRRAGDSPFSAIANRFGTRFPGLTRKWRAGKGSNPLSLSDLDGDLRASRTASSRSSSVSNSVSHGLAISFGDVQMPPTPAMSEFDRHDTPYRDSEEFERLDYDSSERPAGFVSTPLLPPMMMGSSTTSDADVPLQSPLESPSVADPTDYLSGACTPVTGIATPARGMPSPPLSTKPSMSSIRRTHTIAPVHLSTSSSDALPLVIADIDDKWSNTLGHANFTIHPPPYLPSHPDLEACRQLKRDWDLARCNYTKHLVRTGEHYGATSKTYLLTEEKWKETDDLWRANNDATIAATAASGEDAFRSLKHNRVGEAENAMTKIPSLNDPRCEGKFPQLGDEDIVGPMVVGVARMQRRRSRKAGLVKFFAEKFPVGFGRG